MSISKGVLEKIEGHLQKKRGSGGTQALTSYRVSIIGPSLNKWHTEKIQAATPGAALDEVIRGSGCNDCTQFSLFIDQSPPTIVSKGAA